MKSETIKCPDSEYTETVYRVCLDGCVPTLNKLKIQTSKKVADNNLFTEGQETCKVNNLVQI